MKARYVHSLIAALVIAAPLNAQQKSSGALGIDVTGMDRTVRPQDDFFRFVNGGWADRTTIPADKSTYGTIVMVIDKAANEVRALIEETAAKRQAPGSVG